MKLETEQTPEGTQTLIHGVKPLRAIDREKRAYDPMNGGLTVNWAGFRQPHGSRA